MPAAAPSAFLHLLMYAMAPATPVTTPSIPGTQVAIAPPAPVQVVPHGPCNCESADTQPAMRSPWSGRGELGFASATGNSTTESLNTKAGLAYEDNDWLHKLSIAGLRASSEYTRVEEDGRVVRGRQETAERYTLSTSSARKLAEFRQLAASLRAESDQFASYDRQAVFSIGYGTRLWDYEKFQLDLTLGPGYKWARHTDDQAIEQGFIARGNFDISYALTRNTELSNTLLIEAGAENTYGQNDFGVSVSMNSHLALKAGWQVRHNTLVDANLKTTDTLTTMNVVYTLR
ncbi:MAG: DUF481 domain-containing protein [Pseudoxanthomonas sp.]